METLTDFGQRSAATLSGRVRRVRASLLIAIQASVAAGIAWYVAHDLIGHRAPFFAPVSAVIVLGVSVGQRLRRAFELVLGVALGILVGDALIYFIGTGGWQIALGGGAGDHDRGVRRWQRDADRPVRRSSAVLVATLAPPVDGIYYTRFVDALVGGVVGVLVMALLLPVNPLTTVQRAAGPALDLLAAELDRGRRRAGRPATLAARGRCWTGYAPAKASSPGSGRRSGSPAETASLAPVRWRSRAPLAQYVDGAVHIDRAIRNAPGAGPAYGVECWRTASRYRRTC